MNPFTRGNLAVVERELRKVIDNLRPTIDGTCSLNETAVRVHRALREAEYALETIERTVRLEALAEAAE